MEALPYAVIAMLLILACLSPVKESEAPGCTPWPSTCDGATPPSQPCTKIYFYCDTNKCVWGCADYREDTWEWTALKGFVCECVLADGGYDYERCPLPDNDTGTCIP